MLHGLQVVRIAGPGQCKDPLARPGLCFRARTFDSLAQLNTLKYFANLAPPFWGMRTW